MSVEFRPAYAAADIGAELIASQHEHLLGVRVEFVFRSKAASSGGRVVLGRARKISGLNAFLADVDDHDEQPVEPRPFFVVELAEDEWSRLSPRQRVALVDHELSHCVVEIGDDGEPKLRMRGHDLEEFVGVVRRHGLWKHDVRILVAAGADHLDDDDDEGGSA